MWSTPIAFGLAALALPLVVAFLDRRRIRKRSVPSLLLLRHLEAHKPSHSHFALPRHLLALALMVVAMAALVIALAGPTTGEPSRDRYIVVLDTSASMASRDLAEGKTRLQEAASHLIELIDDLDGNDEVALVIAAEEATTLVAPTTRHRRVVDALETARALAPKSELERAVQIADGLCVDSELGRIIVVSDQLATELPETTCAMHSLALGGPTDNIGITALTVREADALGLFEIYVEVQSAAPHATEVAVSLDADGSLVDMVSLRIEAGSTASKLLRRPLPAGQVLAAQLASTDGTNYRDALDLDDRAYASIDRPSRAKVLLVSPFAGSYVGHALVNHPRVDLELHRPSEVENLTTRYDLVIVEGHAGHLPPSDLLVLFGGARRDVPVEFGPALASPSIVRWAFDDPLFEFVDLDGIELKSATPLTAAGATSLIETPEGSIALRLDTPRKTIAFGFEPARTDLVLRVAFVNMMANLVESVLDERPSATVSSATLGSRVGSETWLVPKHRAGGPSPAIIHDEVGVFHREGAADDKTVVVNLLSAGETRNEARGALAETTHGLPAPRREESPFPVEILIAIALGAIASEWLVQLLFGRKRKPVMGEST